MVQQHRRPLPVPAPVYQKLCPDVLDELDGLLRLVQGHRELSTFQLESRKRRDVFDERGQLVGDRRSIRQEQGFKMWFDEQIRRCQ